MLKGFASGIAICLVVIAATFTFAGITAASGSDSLATIWSGLRQGVAFSTTSNTNLEVLQEQAPDTDSQSFFPYKSNQSSGNNGNATTSTSSSRHPRSYAALGDSVASGLGLPYIEAATSQDRRCGRSSQAYAYEVGRQLNYTVSLYACSGASSGDLYTRQWISNSNPYVQLNQAYASGTPALISITAGANDISWSRLIRQCYYGACGTPHQVEELADDVANMQDNLQYALMQIQLRSDSQPPHVVLTGYYNPVSLQCVALHPERITQTEIAWITKGVTALNQALQSTAHSYGSFVRFAPVDFHGHDICSPDSWVQSLSDEAPLHPTAAGQQAIARAVIQAAN